MVIIFAVCPDNSGWEGIDTSWVPIVPSVARWENKSGRLLSQTQLPLIMAWGITIHKSQGLTLEVAVVELGHADFSAGLSFVICGHLSSEDIKWSGILFSVWTGSSSKMNRI